jgi:hypothetical protein
MEFVSEPKDQFYGVESVLKDPFGNWFSMTRRRTTENGFERVVMSLE